MNAIYMDIYSYCFPNLQWNETTPMINDPINIGAKLNMDSTT